MEFASRRIDREQAFLFPERLDEAIGADHSVRLLDELLGRVDWSPWEARYQLQLGRPPIHPRELASVILYGIHKRIHSSRALEEALEVRLDFRWLVHGRSIDHSTINAFRNEHADALKDLFIQIVLIAQQLGHLPLASLGFDGTRMRANNRRSGTRTPEQLRCKKQELAERFQELQQRAREADVADSEQLGDQSPHRLDDEFADLERRRNRVDEAIQELEEIERRGLAVPARLPVTDPHSRVSPNKEGGFAPNYTPTATVDIDSGIVVHDDVVFGQHEDRELLGSLDAVKEDLNLEQHVDEVLADGLMSSGDNIVGCAERGVDLLSPIENEEQANNPAIRNDPSVAVPEDAWERLPRKKVKRKHGATTQLTKAAFVYDESADQYWCPRGERLVRTGQSKERENGREVLRNRYQSAREICASCPLAALCVNAKTGRRMIRHTEQEPVRLRHAEKMRREVSRRRYSRRRHAGERPFALIKHHFGFRQFTVRGREKVRIQWKWLTLAFNLHRLAALIRSNADPPPWAIAT